MRGHTEHVRGLAGPPVAQDAVRRWAVPVLAAAACLVMIGARVALWDYQTTDYRVYVSHWCDTLEAQGLGAFRHRFADYNTPYLYLLWLGTRTGLSSLSVMKLVAVLGDLCLVAALYRVLTGFVRTEAALALAPLVTVLPSVWLVSAPWGQVDSLYTAPLLLCLDAWLRDRQRAAWLWFGVAFAIKLQAVFFVPFLGVAFLLHARRQWASPLLALVPVLLAWFPAAFGGMSFGSYLMTYKDQVSQQGVLTLTMNFWSFFAFRGVQRGALLGAATCLAAAVALAVGAFVLVFSRWHLDRGQVVAAAATYTLWMPYLLPNMRGRYFFPGMILVIVLAVVRPRLWWLVPATELVLDVSLGKELYGYAFPLDVRVWAALLGVLAVLVLRECGRVDVVGPVPPLRRPHPPVSACSHPAARAPEPPPEAAPARDRPAPRA